MANGDFFPEPGKTKLTIQLEHERLTFTLPEIAGQLTAKLSFPRKKCVNKARPFHLLSLLAHGHRPPLVPCAAASVLS